MSYLTTKEAALLARRHPDTVRDALEAGELHGYQRIKGGRWTIHVACLAAWIERRRCGHTPER